MIDQNTPIDSPLEFTQLCPLVTAPMNRWFYAPTRSKSITSYRSNRMAEPGRRARLVSVNAADRTADVMLHSKSGHGAPQPVFNVPWSFLQVVG